jgi:toxin ParE1/3/4
VKPVEFSPAARADLVEIGQYIAQDNPDRAEGFIAELEGRIHAIAERPQSFPARDDIAAGLRAAAHGRYRIFFRDLAPAIRIIRVLHSARDMKLLIED